MTPFEYITPATLDEALAILREDDGAQEQADDTVLDHAANGANKDNQSREINTASQQDRLENIVTECHE